MKGFKIYILCPHDGRFSDVFRPNLWWKQAWWNWIYMTKNHDCLEHMEIERGRRLRNAPSDDQ